MGLPKQTGNVYFVLARRSSDIVIFNSVDVFVQGCETRFASRGVLLEICCGSFGKGGTHEVRG